MKVFVTGGTGFIGSHIVDALLEQGYEVKCLIRKNSDITWLKGKNIEFVEASLYDISSLEKAVGGCDYVIHVAGMVAAKNYAEYYKANCEGTINLVKACISSTPNLKKFTFVSSQTASGPAISFEQPTNEEMAEHPLSSYGKSKYEAEQELKQYYDKLPITIVRPPAVYGPRDKAIYTVFKTAAMGIGTIIGFNPKHVSLIHSQDLVDGILLATFSVNSTSQTYFISSDEFYTWDLIMDLMKEGFGKKFFLKIKLPHSLVHTLGIITEGINKFSNSTPVFNKEKAVDFVQENWICSIEKAKKELNYNPKVKIKDGIFQTIKWYKENGWL